MWRTSSGVSTARSYYDARMATLFLDVEAGDNCPYSLQLVFSALGEPRTVRAVRLYLTGPDGVLFDVTGWEDGPAPAEGVVVEDSGQGQAYLVHGGSGGLRFRPYEYSGDWDLSDTRQWGESHLLIAEAEDIVWAQVS